MDKYRLENTERLDRQSNINFTFDGKQYQGFKGDSLASALMSNGVSIVGRSFKYHRPRGLISAGVEEANGVVQLGRAPFEEPNVKMTTVNIYEGLEAKSVNCWPNAEHDLLAIAGLAKPFFVSGFYYKVFKWPGWKFWSPVVRRMAGLGTIPKADDQDCYDLKHHHTDILIVGSGPAGLSTTLDHAKTGKQVLLVEQDLELGGSFLFEQINIGDVTAFQWVQNIVSELKTYSNVTILSHATAAGYYDHNLVTISERFTRSEGGDKNGKNARERFWHVRAEQVVLATGAIERPLVFQDNDRPGVMLASAVRTYVNRYEVSPGREVVVATNNDDAYRTAIDLHHAGVKVKAIIDVRSNLTGTQSEFVRALGIKIYEGHVLTQAIGRRRVRKVTISPIDIENNMLVGQSFTINCDTVAVSGGWSPVVHLHSQSGGKLKFDNKIQAFVPREYVQSNICIGAANGQLEISEILEGMGAEKIDPLVPLWDLPKNLPHIRHSKRWVDFQHDVTATDVALAARENYTSVEHFKRYTTTGMAMDQGKTSNINALAILGQETNREIPEVGTTKFRPPYTPVTMGAMVGRNRNKIFRPIRHLACHDWHVNHGGILDEFGSWMRATCYPLENETIQNSIIREVNKVREAVGILDYSPLGKIDVRGMDAAEFLHKFYINNVKSLKVGHARYGLMLNEQGTVMEDGVFSRLADDHFWLTTTSGHAAMIASWLDEWRQCEWSNMDVVITPMTTGWGTISVQGPKSRDLIAKLDFDFDISNEAFPHMTVRQSRIDDVDIRILRTSFTGELGYELSVPLSYMQSLWTHLMHIGADLDIVAFGIEALLVMRTEKGYLHVGGDTDSATTPEDIGFGRIAKNKKDDFIGKRSLTRAVALDEGREAFVGFEAVGTDMLPIGGIIMAKGHKTAPAPMDGRITSSCFSPTLNRPIALGLLKGGNDRMGEIVKIYDMEGVIEAKVVGTCFYDQEGVRVHG